MQEVTMDFFNGGGARQKRFYAALISGIIVASVVLILVLNLNRDPERIISKEVSQSSKNSVESGEISESASESAAIEVVVPQSSRASSSRHISSSDPADVHSIFSYSEPEPIGPTSLPELSQSRSNKTVRVIITDQSSERKPQESVAPSEQSSEAAPQSEQQPQSEHTPEPETSQAQPPKEPNYVAGVLGQDAYERQENGNNPVYVYRHPTLDMALDFRGDLNLAKRLYVLPLEDGFYLFDRSMLSLLGLSTGDKQALTDETRTPGAIYLRPLSKATKALAEAEDRSAIFKSFGDRYVMLEQLSWLSDEQRALLGALGEKPVDVYRLEPFVRLGQKTENDYPEQTLDAAAEWKAITANLVANPAAVEWRYGLPLYADHPNYHGKQADLRSVRPVTAPSYRFGQIDLDGDEQPEYVIHASAKGDAVNRIQGYWAIFQPSSTGMQLIAASNYANGPMIRTAQGLSFLSGFEADDHITLFSTATALPMRVKDEAVSEVSFYRPAGLLSTLSGKALAEAYPNCSIVASADGSGYYLVDTAALIGWRDAFVDATAGGGYYSAEGLRDGFYAEPISVEDPIAYLSAAYPALPFTDEALKEAVPLSRFAHLETPLTEAELR